MASDGENRTSHASKFSKVRAASSEGTVSRREAEGQGDPALSTEGSISMVSICLMKVLMTAGGHRESAHLKAST